MTFRKTHPSEVERRDLRQRLQSHPPSLPERASARPQIAGSRRSSTIPEYAKLIALWIGQHHPRHFALPDVHTGCAECDESLDLGVLIVRSEVEVKAVLDLFAFVDRLEDESREPIWVWPNLELARIVVDDDPSEGLEPPVTERHWVTGVDDDLLPHEAHEKTIRHLPSCGDRPFECRRRLAKRGGTMVSMTTTTTRRGCAMTVQLNSLAFDATAPNELA